MGALHIDPSDTPKNIESILYYKQLFLDSNALSSNSPLYFNVLNGASFLNSALRKGIQAGETILSNALNTIHAKFDPLSDISIDTLDDFNNISQLKPNNNNNNSMNMNSVKAQSISSSLNTNSILDTAHEAISLAEQGLRSILNGVFESTTSTPNKQKSEVYSFDSEYTWWWDDMDYCLCNYWDGVARPRFDDVGLGKWGFPLASNASLLTCSSIYSRLNIFKKYGFVLGIVFYKCL